MHILPRLLASVHIARQYVSLVIVQSLYNLEHLVSSTDISNPAILPTLNLSGLVCQDDFFERNFTCLPQCAVWEQYSHQSRVVLDVIWVFEFVTLQLAGIAIIGTFAIRRKSM